MGHKRRAIQMQKANVKFASWRQWTKLSGRFVFSDVQGKIMTVGMKNVLTSSLFFCRRPVVAFVLIAFVTGIDEVLKLVGPARRAWLIMIDS